MEIWTPIKDFELQYEISNLGNVRSIKTNRLRKPQVHEDGYLCLLFCVNYKRYVKYYHRLIAETYIPNPNNLPEVNHIDGNKLNNSVSNLEWCTHQNNIIHAHKTGLIKQCCGINNNFAKLTELQVIEIRANINKLNSIKLAKQYNVCKDTIRDILNRKTWKHL